MELIRSVAPFHTTGRIKSMRVRTAAAGAAKTGERMKCESGKRVASPIVQFVMLSLLFVAGPANTAHATLLPITFPFEKYAVDEIYSGKVAMPILSDEKAMMFRTRLCRTTEEKVNFAGEYVLSTWGCGAGCVDGAVVSHKTGQIIFLPTVTLPVWEPFFYGFSYAEKNNMRFTPHSRLLIIVGALHESEEPKVHYYEYTKHHFVHVKSEPIWMLGP